MSRAKCPELSRLPKLNFNKRVNFRHNTPGTTLLNRNRTVDPTHPAARSFGPRSWPTIAPKFLSPYLKVRAIPKAILAKPDTIWPDPPYGPSEKLSSWRERAEIENGLAPQPPEPVNSTPTWHWSHKRKPSYPVSLQFVTGKKNLHKLSSVRQAVRKRLRLAILLAVTRGADADLPDKDKAVTGVKDKTTRAVKDGKEKEARLVFRDDKVQVLHDWCYILSPTLEVYRMPYPELVALVRSAFTKIYQLGSTMEDKWREQGKAELLLSKASTKSAAKAPTRPLYNKPFLTSTFKTHRSEHPSEKGSSLASRPKAISFKRNQGSRSMHTVARGSSAYCLVPQLCIRSWLYDTDPRDHFKSTMRASSLSTFSQPIPDNRPDESGTQKIDGGNPESPSSIAAVQCSSEDHTSSPAAIPGESPGVNVESCNTIIAPGPAAVNMSVGTLSSISQRQQSLAEKLAIIKASRRSSFISAPEWRQPQAQKPSKAEDKRKKKKKVAAPSQSSKKEIESRPPDETNRAFEATLNAPDHREMLKLKQALTPDLTVVEERVRQTRDSTDSKPSTTSDPQALQFSQQTANATRQVNRKESTSHAVRSPAKIVVTADGRRLVQRGSSRQTQAPSSNQEAPSDQPLESIDEARKVPHAVRSPARIVATADGRRLVQRGSGQPPTSSTQPQQERVDTESAGTSGQAARSSPQIVDRTPSRRLLTDDKRVVQPVPSHQDMDRERPSPIRALSREKMALSSTRSTGENESHVSENTADGPAIDFGFSTIAEEEASIMRLVSGREDRTAPPVHFDPYDTLQIGERVPSTADHAPSKGRPTPKSGHSVSTGDRPLLTGSHALSMGDRALLAAAERDTNFGQLHEDEGTNKNPPRFDPASKERPWARLISKAAREQRMWRKQQPSVAATQNSLELNMDSFQPQRGLDMSTEDASLDALSNLGSHEHDAESDAEPSSQIDTPRLRANSLGSLAPLSSLSVADAMYAKTPVFNVQKPAWTESRTSPYHLRLARLTSPRNTK
ncbi:hypothetical protein PLICRDRAFT_51722 [Plicaturopsis crispa FD-325 SS-3]|nr:hypothetical protein PLICRDRAFT_51722 [Plicaturopsis crispa FD-325 SS-3]